MYLTRIVQRGGWAVILAWTTTLGCGSPAPKASPSSSEKKAPTSSAAKAANPTASKSSPSRSADAFAAAFLAQVQAGTATPDQLSASFRSLIAEPVLEADRAAGYSHAEAEKWLRSFTGSSFQCDAKPVFATADVAGFRGRAGSATFALRVRKTGSGWVVDWFAPIGPAAIPLPVANAESFTAAAFLDAVVSKSERFAEGLLTTGAKTREAPPFASDKTRGYNRGVLKRRLEEFRGGAVAYNLAAVSGDTVTGTLGSQPFTLKLSPGTEPGQWLIDSFEKK